MKGNNKAKELSLLAKGKIAFDKLEKREQNLLIVLVPTTIIVVFFLLLIEPEFNKSGRLADSVSRLESQLALSRQSNLELLQQAKIDPDIAVSQQIEGLQKSLAKLNHEFEGELSQLVSPQAMPVLLEQIFTKANDLSLINMTSVAPQVLNANANEQSNSSGNKTQMSQQPIYRHGIEITFEGSFFATRDFLAQAETLGWKLYWQDLSYAVSDHPSAITKLTLFTLSTSEAFIGVN
jgi:MSHA biogenesis protein MshJ